jgi:uncharacterized membrane protein HdeD (DUF308 family)
MSQPATVSQAAAPRARWKWFLALGAVLVVLGIAGIGVASMLELTSLLVFGPLLLVSSIIQLLTAFFAEDRKESLLRFAAAGLEAVLGFFIMANPPERIGGLITVIAVFFIVIGLARAARSLATHSRRRAFGLVAGVIALLLGICVWVGGPTGKLGFVGLCIAVDFLCHGVSWSALALMQRKSEQTPVSSSEQRLA